MCVVGSTIGSSTYVHIYFIEQGTGKQTRQDFKAKRPIFLCVFPPERRRNTFVGSINGNTGSLGQNRSALLYGHIFPISISIAILSIFTIYQLTFSANSSRGRREIVGVALMSSLVGDGVIMAIISSASVGWLSLMNCTCGFGF